MKKEKQDRISKVEAGEMVSIPTVYTVKQPCSDKTNGSWRCITHARTFTNQFEKDIHITNTRVKHRLVWLCGEHGPEEP